jgi:hypothetical protein
MPPGIVSVPSHDSATVAAVPARNPHRQGRHADQTLEQCLQKQPSRSDKT